MIKELYAGQTVLVRFQKEETKQMRIGRGVGEEECCKSLALFSGYAEKLMDEAYVGREGNHNRRCYDEGGKTCR